MSLFIVQTACEAMPASCFGAYGKVAVIETDGRNKVAMISERARGVVRIVKCWRRLYRGKTAQCAFEIAKAEATALANQLNSESK